MSFFSRLFGRDRDPQAELTTMREALARWPEDPEAVEQAMSRMKLDTAEMLAAYWSANDSWERKDGFVTLLREVPVEKVPALKPMMEDALLSPTVDTRAYALVSLTGNYKQFTSWLNSDRSLDPDSVDRSIAEWHKST